MGRLRLFSKTWISYFIIFLAAFLIIYLFSQKQIKQISLNDQINELTDLALAMSVELSNYERLDDEAIRKIILTQARISRVRVTNINTSGQVLFDTESQAEQMESHRYRPEIDRALAGEVSAIARYSDTLRQRMLYVAVPLRKQGQIFGVCRVSRQFKLAVSSYLATRNQVLEVLLLLVLVVGLLSYLLLKRIFRPLDVLSDTVEKAVAGQEHVSVSPSLLSILRPLSVGVNKLIERNRELSGALDNDREVFQGFIEATDEGWLVVDQNGRIIMENQSLRRMFPEILTGGEFFWQALRSPELNELINQARNSPEPVQGQLEKNGRSYQCLVNWLSRRRNFILKFSDVTETKDLSRRKKEFIANLAHELKTPLTAISGFLEAMEDEKLSSEGKNYLDIIKKNTGRLVRLVEDLSRLSELEEKGFGTEKEPVDLVELARTVGEAYQKEAQSKGLYLKLELEPMPLLQADGFQLEQLLVNLIENAIRYTEKGGVVVKVEKKDGWVLLSVKDTGIGIAEEHIPRIFERFYVIDKSRSRKTGGTGLGLAIVKHVVQAHNGRIEVKSSPGFGTTIEVWLPALKPDSQPA